MFSFYILLEKPIFLSLMGGSGGKMRRKKSVDFMFKIEIEKYTKKFWDATQRCGHLLAKTMNVLWME